MRKEVKERERLRKKRFWERVDKNGPIPASSPGLGRCWIWTGPTPNRYGAFNGGNTAFAHRYSWQIANGRIRKRIRVLHKCDNPPCVNPEHLFLGTHKDNMIDCARKRRTTIGLLNPRVKLSSENDVIAIREAIAGGEINSIVGARYGITDNIAGQIARGSLWPHVGGPLTVRKPGRPRRSVCLKR